jgi:hypothetical protein
VRTSIEAGDVMGSENFGSRLGGCYADGEGVQKVDAANGLALLKADGRFAALPVAASRAVTLGGRAGIGLLKSLTSDYSDGTDWELRRAAGIL